MNKLTNGTSYRDTPNGLIAVRGKRELHLLGTSVAGTSRAREMLAGHSFDRLFRVARKAPYSRNVAFLRVAVQA